jgi:uncharacterized Zn finger protein (UPF0148 family)
VNIREINIKFSTEDQCLAYVEQVKWPDGVVRCPTCGDTNITKYEGRKTKRKPRNPQKPRRSLRFHGHQARDVRQARSAHGERP